LNGDNINEAGSYFLGLPASFDLHGSAMFMQFVQPRDGFSPSSLFCPCLGDNNLPCLAWRLLEKDVTVGSA